MTFHVIVGFEEVWDINPTSLLNQIDEDRGDYCVWHDKKWYKFCKDHNFNPTKDAYTKIYDLYLRLCAEGLI